MNKKISVGLTIAIAALAAAIAFFAGSSIVRDKINKTLIDVNEKQAIYNRLSELDNSVRTNIDTDNIDEKLLMDSICKGYIEGLDNDKFTYMTAEEFASADIDDDKLTVINFSDGSALIIAKTDSATASDTQ